MARLQATNNARTTLDGNINSNDTTINVADASVFPSVPFMITVGNHTNNMEIMKVIDVDSNALTVERARENTNPVSHNDGVVVQNNFTAGTYTELASDFDAHKAETMSKVVLISEPFDQVTKTTVNLGFKPKYITIDAVIRKTKYSSFATMDENGVRTNKHYRPIDDTSDMTGSEGVYFMYSLSNYVKGDVTITENGLEIDWDVIGTLPDVSDDRRLIISALTHGSDD